MINKQKIIIKIKPEIINNNTLDLAFLMRSLDELCNKYIISKIEIDNTNCNANNIYLDVLYKLVQSYYDNTTILTDLSNVQPPLINDFDNIEIIFNFNDINYNIINNIKALKSIKDVTAISYDIQCNKNLEDNIKLINDLNIKSWKILPNIDNIKLYDNNINIYEALIKSYLNLTHLMKFAFINKLELDNIINRDNYNTITVYLDSNNKYSLIKFKDHKGYNEYYNNIEELDKEIIKYNNIKDNLCKKCIFKSKCLANNIDFDSFGNLCPSFGNLLVYFNKK